MTRADAKEMLQSQDPVGNVTSVTPADAAAHTYSYNEVNEVTAYTPPAVTPPTQAETTTYDLDGLVTSTGHSDGTSTTVTREASGRVTAVTSPWWANSFTYLPSGQVATATRGAQSLGWAYDGFLVKTETANGVVSGWSYDSDFRVTSHAINDAGVGYTYDNDSLLTSAGVATLTRSPDSGFLTALTVGTVTTAYGYNGYGEVESVNTGTLYSEVLQYDSAGRLTVMQESVNGTPTQYTYTYDSVGRLTSATKDGTTTTSWTYDGNGNRVTENGVTSTFDAQDRLLTRGSTSYTWDALGGRKTKTEGGQTTQYTHDGLGALLSVTLPDSTQLTYEYDARQRRVAKRRNGTVETRWVYDGQYRVAAQLDATGAVTHRFVYGSQSHSPDYVVTGGVTYAYVKNHLGSIRFVVNAATGAVAQQLDYDAWGSVLTDSAPGFQPFAFAGGIYDRDTKLTHFGYRDYDASVGVWTAKDPIRLRGGFNTYEYVLGQPLVAVDPEGLILGIPYTDFVTPAVGLVVVAAGGGDVKVKNGPTGEYLENCGNSIQKFFGYDTTYGDIVCYANPGEAQRTQKHEQGHLVQYDVLQSVGLGELYLPLHLYAQAYSAVTDMSRNVHRFNPLEHSPLQPNALPMDGK